MATRSERTYMVFSEEKKQGGGTEYVVQSDFVFNPKGKKQKNGFVPMFAEPIALSSSSGINVSKSRVGDTFLLLLLLLLLFFQDDALVILYNIYGGATIQQDAIAPYKGTSLPKNRLAQWPTRSSPLLFIATNFPFPARTHTCCTTFF